MPAPTNPPAHNSTARVNQRLRRTSPGFTLIELLVAIAVLAVVAVLGWRALDGIIRARGNITESMEHSRGMMLTFAQLQNDCSMLTAGVDIPGRSALVADGERLIMIRNVYADNQPTRLEVVVYRLREGTLTRQESQATRNFKELDTMWQAAVEDRLPDQAVTLQTKIEGMTVQSWFSDAPGWRVATMDTKNMVANAVAAVPGAAANQSSAPTGNAPGNGAAVATPAPTTAIPNNAVPSPIGVEVSLKIAGLTHPITKIFLIGSA